MILGWHAERGMRGVDAIHLALPVLRPHFADVRQPSDWMIFVRSCPMTALSKSTKRAVALSLLLSWGLASSGCVTYGVVKDEWKEPTTPEGYAIATAAELGIGVTTGLSMAYGPDASRDDIQLDAKTIGIVAASTVGLDLLGAFFFMLVFKSDDSDF